MAWRKTKNVGAGSKQGFAQDVKGDEEDCDLLRRNLHKGDNFIYQDLIDGYLELSQKHNSYEVGTFVRPINGEGEEC